MRVRTGLTPIVCATAFLATGFFMSSASAATFVYVGSSDSQDVTVLELKANGDLTPVETTAVPGPAKPGGSLPLAVSPNKKLLYAGLRNEPYTAVTFAIDAKTGKLTKVGPGPLADSMAYIVTDRTGKFLLSASYGGNKVTVNPIGAKNIVEPAQQTMATEPNAHCIVTDPTNHYVLHTSLGGDVIYQEKFDAKTGKLTPNDPPTVSVKAKAGPRHLVFSPNKKFVYLVNELDASIYVFPWDAKTGTLKKETQVTTALPKGFSGKPWAADIHITPDGKFLYASERTTSTLAAFSVDAKTGALTSIDSYPTEKQPRGFNIDPTGRYLLSVGQLSNSMTSYSIDKRTGKLTKLKEYPMGKNPNWVEVVSF
ncbi:MAG: 6-phosphogluconolactonase [Tardiphaga sp.]|jgi:6-phosphogluconolactonase|nr:6-phosphogluconolactonase [Tardiphaga sp.]